MEFKKNEQGVCPICGGHNLDWGDMDMSGDSLHYDWHCPDCNHDGQEWYRLTFDGHEVLVEDRDGQYDWENVNDYILPEE